MPWENHPQIILDFCQYQSQQQHQLKQPLGRLALLFDLVDRHINSLDCCFSPNSLRLDSTLADYKLIRSALSLAIFRLVCVINAIKRIEYLFTRSCLMQLAKKYDGLFSEQQFANSRHDKSVQFDGFQFAPRSHIVEQHNSRCAASNARPWSSAIEAR